MPKNSLFLYFSRSIPHHQLFIISIAISIPKAFHLQRHKKNCQFPYIEIKFLYWKNNIINTSPLPFPSRPILPSIHPKALPSSSPNLPKQRQTSFFSPFLIFFLILKNSSLYLFSPQFPIFPTQKHTPNFLPPISQALPRKKNTILVLGSALSSSFSDNHEKKNPFTLLFSLICLNLCFCLCL